MNTTGDPGASYARCLDEEKSQRAREQRWLAWLVRVRIADLVLTVVLAGQACSHGAFIIRLTTFEFSVPVPFFAAQ